VKGNGQQPDGVALRRVITTDGLVRRGLGFSSCLSISTVHNLALERKRTMKYVSRRRNFAEHVPPMAEEPGHQFGV
jgi:hypothetical protein